MHFFTLVDKASIDRTDKLQKTLYPSKLCIIDTYDNQLKNLSKIFKTYDFINNTDIPGTDVICILDGFDVLFNCRLYKEQDLEEWFISTGNDMIISGECVFAHHDPSIKPLFDSKHKGKHKYLNSGVIIAYKHIYLQIVSEIINNISKYKSTTSHSDQRVLGLYMAEKWESDDFKINVVIDDTQECIATLNTAFELDTVDFTCFFVHVTWVNKLSQQQKYQKFLRYLLDK